MKYHDSIKTADKIMLLAVAQLKKWQLAINPINYAIVYEYYKKSNKQLIAAIEKELGLNERLNGFFMENLYKEHLLEDSQFREEIMADLSQLLTVAQKDQELLSNSSDLLIKDLDANLPRLSSENKEQAASALQVIEQSFHNFKTEKQQLASQLNSSKQKSLKLADELAKARQQVNLDSVTGLFNTNAISSHIEAWREQDIACEIAAIVINVENFQTIECDFGVLFADVILAKIAHKVSTYVNDSGLPVRLSYNQFLLLLPNINHQTADEIGIKIMQGVSKMRFVSLKSAITLPNISVNYKVNHMQQSQDADSLLSKIK